MIAIFYRRLKIYSSSLLLGKHQKKSTALYPCISEVVSMACNLAHGLAGAKETTMKSVQRYIHLEHGIKKSPQHLKREQ
jgi:hypothetical protein